MIEEESDEKMRDLHVCHGMIVCCEGKQSTLRNNNIFP